ncbi:MAG: CAP domain-containing protein [Sphingomicrobium sp.]
MLIRILTLLLLLAPCASPAVAGPLPSPNWPGPADRGEAVLQAAALRLHNQARRAFGVTPLAWNAQLAEAARGYAERMAATGIYDHDATPGRRKAMGENIWRGARGVFSYEMMVGVMIDEVRLFDRGVFPAVSRTGNWHDVAHYTQIIWPTTTEIGCGLASGATMDYFVCRYAPAGNKDGTMLDPTLRIAERGN